MNVLFLQGSPRAKGNTDVICQHMAETLRAGGDSVETLQLARMGIGGCIECFVCQKDADGPGCPVDDRMGEVYERALAADAVVLATPVFCWGMSAQLKAVVDRFYAFCKFSVDDSGKFRSLVEGKRTALVVTAGGGPFDGAELCVASFRAMTGFMRMDNRGEFVAAPVTSPAEVKADKALMARAAEFARGLVA